MQVKGRAGNKIILVPKVKYLSINHHKALLRPKSAKGAERIE